MWRGKLLKWVYSHLSTHLIKASTHLITTHLKALLQQNPEPTVALSAQKNPLAEQNQNVSHVQRPTELIRQVRLEQGGLH